MQTRLGSFVEAWANIVVGFAINFAANMYILPAFGFASLTPGKNFVIGLAYTGISLVRSYGMRRIFNAIKFGNDRLARAARIQEDGSILEDSAALNTAVCAKHLREIQEILSGGNAAEDINPKTLIGATKVPLHLVPPAAIHHMALAFEDGAKKYGPYNWREKAVPMMTYIGAALRHLHALLDGQDMAADSKRHHAAHAADCCAIILDALEIGKLVDDRPPNGAAPRLQAEYAAARLP